MRNSIERALAVACGTGIAGLVALAVGTAYQEGESAAALAILAFPAAISIVIYRGTGKAPLSTVATIFVAAVLLNAALLAGVSSEGAVGVVMALIASTIPIAADLVSVDLGRRLRFDPRLSLAMSAAFALFLLPLGTWSVVAAHRTILVQDAALVTELASRITPEGNALVVDHLSPKLSERAQRRVAIRSNGKTYQLADAVEERTVRTRTTKKGGGEPAEMVTSEQEERMRLILKLQGTSIPDDVVVFSRRGPLTIYESKVAIPSEPAKVATPNAGS